MLNFHRPKKNVCLRKADIFVQPSIDDAYPHAIMEAMLLGKPSICFPVGIGLEECAKDSVFVVNEISYQALAQAMMFLIENPDARERLAKNSQQLIKERFDMKESVAQYWDILQDFSIEDGIQKG